MELEIRDNRQKEWFWLDNEFIDSYAKKLKTSGIIVYISLCRYADNNTQTCFPSMKHIAKENGISKDTVLRAIKKLENFNLIHITREEHNRENGVQTRNRYTMLNKKVWGQSSKSASVPESQNEVEQSSKNQQSRVAPEGYNNTYIKNTQLTTLTSFDSFWKAYPKRENRKGCEEKWNKKKLDLKVKEIIDFIEKAKESDRWKKGYIKAPLVFLNQESWNDDISAYEDINKSPKGVMKF